MVAAVGMVSGDGRGCGGRSGHGLSPHKRNRARPVSSGGARSTASLRRHAANCHRDLFGAEVRCAYGVRSAVTRRASRIIDLEPAARRQEASKFGQDCCEQSLPTVRISSRSPLASACGTLASTCGAKPGKHGERGGDERSNSDGGKSLDHDGPLSWAFAARRFVGWTCTQRQFPAVFAKRRKWFRPGRSFVSSAIGGRNNAGSPGETLEARNWFSGRSEIKSRPGGEPVRLAGPPGAG